MIFNFMAKRKKSGLVSPTLHYCGHNAKKIGPKKSLLKICTLQTLIRCTALQEQISKMEHLTLLFCEDFNGYFDDNSSSYPSQNIG